MIKVVTGKIRMSYVNIFNPKAVAAGDEPKYSLCVLIPKTDKSTIQKINSAVEAARKAGSFLWGGSRPENLKTPLRDGDAERAEMEEYKGHYFINAVSKRKPEIVDRSLRTIFKEEEVYAGCYGRVSLSFYAFNKADNKGVGCGLLNIQKLEEGQPLVSISKAEEDFEEEKEDVLW
jgi:hypothetical protein